MNTVLEKPKTDWLQAKATYVANPTTSYEDIARLFGVSVRQVERHGSDEEWLACRQDVGMDVESLIREKVADERVEINEKHRKQYASLQAIIRTYLVVINNHNKKVIEDSKAKGKTPNPRKLYSPKNLYYLTKTLREATEGERVTLDLPNVIIAPAGWKPPQNTEA